MDTLQTMRLLVRIIDRRSFSAAATDLGLARSTVTEAIKQLEARLGVRLLQRTTRHVAPTLEGEAYHQRCVSILADIDEAEGAFATVQPRGTLRIDVHGALARHFLLPHMPAFLARYPDLDLHIGAGDRLVDLVREGVDCVVRGGAPIDSGMIVRHLGLMQQVTCASPGYLARHGMPSSPDDLAGHMAIGFVSSRTSAVLPLVFTAGTTVKEVVLPSRVTVTSSDAGAALALLGLGLLQAPRYRFDADLASGALVQVLQAYPPVPLPISALYPHARQLSPRVRVFVDWLADLFASHRTEQPQQ